jgi:hypothetical protein
MEKTKLKILKANNDIPSLFEIQNFIEGDIERVQINRRYCFIVNEAARISNMPVNEEATKIYSSFNNTKKYIFGNALLVKTKLICFSWMCINYINNYLNKLSEEIITVAVIL